MNGRPGKTVPIEKKNISTASTRRTTRPINTKKVIDKLNTLNINNPKSDYVGLSYDVPILEDKLFPSQDIQFEGFTVMAPKDIDYCLRTCYGDDYMTPPPEAQRVVKHSYDAYLE